MVHTGMTSIQFATVIAAAVSDAVAPATMNEIAISLATTIANAIVSTYAFCFRLLLWLEAIIIVLIRWSILRFAQNQIEHHMGALKFAKRNNKHTKNNFENTVF